MTDYLKLYNEETLTSDLNYRWIKPQRPAPLSYQPDWTRLTELNIISDLAQQIDNAEWRVAHIRRQIRRLGLKPEGRARVKLARQMLEAFLDAAHLQQEVQNLREEERIYYTYLLFYTELEDYQTRPADMTKLYPFTTLLEDLYHNVAQAASSSRRPAAARCSRRGCSACSRRYRFPSMSQPTGRRPRRIAKIRKRSACTSSNFWGCCNLRPSS